MPNAHDCALFRSGRGRQRRAMPDLSVLNSALTRTGEAPLTSLTGSSAAQQIASQNYEPLVEAHLSIYPWKRQSNTWQLARIDPDVHGEPPEPWTAAYQKPVDAIEIRTVKIAGVPIAYEVHSDKILCDAGEDEIVVLHGIWRAAETSWPPWFREGITITLEALFLRGIGERHREAAEREEAAREWWAKAKNRDAQSQPPRDPVGSPTLAARSGGVSRFSAMPTDAR